VTIANKGTAANSFKNAAAGLDSCMSYVAGKGSDSAKFKVARMSFSNLGDETLAYKLTGEAGGFPFTASIVTFRLGDNIVFMTALGIGGSNMDAKDFEPLVKKAVQKVADAA
jgi:hypothetical protein